jgi:phosphoglycolate phosphatase (TIGR01487 family)
MHFLVLAADYDGTLAWDGKVDDRTIDSLQRLRASGRTLLLVTGRHLPDLRTVFDRLDLFDRVVAENGGLLYRPQSHEEKPLADPPDPRFLNLLRERGIPYSAGRTIVATWKPHENAVLEAIRDLGLELQVIFNKEAVMVLPSGVNKGTGLKAALKELAISPQNVVAIGDAENDHALLRMAGCSVAVANALDVLKEEADIVTRSPRGQGVTEICDQLLENDLENYQSKPHGHAASLVGVPDPQPRSGDRREPTAQAVGDK